MARKYQDTQFIIEELNGFVVSEFKGLVDHKSPDNSPIIVNLKTKNDTRWFRFFLDAGLAFWEEWDDLIDEPDEETREVNYAETYHLRDKVIKRIKCINSTINIDFKGNERFILKFKDENDIDSG